MQKIGLLSDTHGNFDLARTAVKYLIEKESVGQIWHLGDSYSDIEQLKSEVDVPVSGVPGTYCPEYKGDDVANKLTATVDEIIFLLVHDRGEVTDEEKTAANVVLYGHTHQYKIFPSAGKIFINPGHLSKEFDRGKPASFAMITVEGYKLGCTIFDMECNVLARASYLIDTSTGG